MMRALDGKKLELALVALTVMVAAWSFIDPHDRLTWWLEAAPVIIALPILIVTHETFRLTRLIYLLLLFHAVVLLVGAHYTYAEVPLFNWIRDEYGMARNHYDRVGHLMQGFVPAMVARELLLRTSPLKSGKWLFVIITLSCLGISAIYELIEWVAAATSGEAAQAFLGTQGDDWDTQKDMALAGLGAILALVFLSRWHDRQLAELK
jgi:putative membrane protein